MEGGSARSLFEAVADRDYEALVTLYASHARTRVLSHLSLKQRWVSSNSNTAPTPSSTWRGLARGGFRRERERGDGACEEVVGLPCCFLFLVCFAAFGAMAPRRSGKSVNGAPNCARGLSVGRAEGARQTSSPQFCGGCSWEATQFWVKRLSQVC